MKKLFGTTLLIGSTELDTRFGRFEAHTYQDIIDKKYIIALARPPFTDQIVIRAHSSCLTSETLHSVDCDCVEQLEGALREIERRGSGILFYLMQSGRGASYIAKSRGCQLVQYRQEEITTFEAYASMGLKDDYRDYRNVGDICRLLEIEQRDFLLMTNNPDKIAKLSALGLNIAETIQISFPTNRFNASYLYSKLETGHLLCYQKTRVPDHATTLPSIEPFEPYHLEEARRFIHISSYYLPILIPDFSTPEWFRIDVYYDTGRQVEHLILSYGDPNKSPLLRIHHEVIFNRFPLTHDFYRRRYQTAVAEIVKHGSGLIALMNHNGTSQSLAHLILDSEEDDPDERIDSVGLSKKRCLQSVMPLIKHHLGGRSPAVFYGDSIEELSSAFDKAGIEVDRWVEIDAADRFGHLSLRRRIDRLEPKPTPSTGFFNFGDTRPEIISGIGSSETVARLISRLTGLVYRPYSGLPIPPAHELLITQGLSPQIRSRLTDPSTQWLMSAQSTDPEKQKIIDRFAERGHWLEFEGDDDDSTLIRITGPFRALERVLAEFGMVYQPTRCLNLPWEFIRAVVHHQAITVVTTSPVTGLHQNLEWKLKEGAFLSRVEFIDEYALGHGEYQWSEYLRRRGIVQPHLLINTGYLRDALTDYPVAKVETEYADERQLLELEQLFNRLLDRLIDLKRVDQRNWAGKETQCRLYTRVK